MRRQGNFEREIQRRVNPMLFLCRNRLQARKMNAHPECWQIWCTSQRGEKYFVHIIKDMLGHPRDPSEIDAVALQKMDAAGVHGGRTSWIQDSVKDQKQHQEDRERLCDEHIQQWFAPGGEGHSRLRHLVRNKLVVPVQQEFSKVLHGIKRRPR